MASKFDSIKLQTSKLIEQEVLEIGDGYRAKNSEMGHTGLPFARAGNINNGFQFEDADLLSQEQIRRAGAKISRPGDVVFTSKGTVGRFAFVREDTPQFVYSPQLCYWRSKDAKIVDPRFLYYWLCGPEFAQQVNGVKGQTDMAEYVSLGDQRKMHITLPPIETQVAIGSFLGVLDDKIDLNRRMNETLEQTARALFKDWFVDFGPTKAKMAEQAAYLEGDLWDLFPGRLDELGVPEGWASKPLDQIADFLNGLALQKYPADGEGDLPAIKIAELRSGVTEKSGKASRKLPEKYIKQSAK